MSVWFSVLYMLHNDAWVWIFFYLMIFILDENIRQIIRNLQKWNFYFLQLIIDLFVSCIRSNYEWWNSLSVVQADCFTGSSHLLILVSGHINVLVFFSQKNLHMNRLVPVLTLSALVTWWMAVLEHFALLWMLRVSMMSLLCPTLQSMFLCSSCCHIISMP